MSPLINSSINKLIVNTERAIGIDRISFLSMHVFFLSTLFYQKHNRLSFASSLFASVVSVSCIINNLFIKILGEISSAFFMLMVPFFCFGLGIGIRGHLGLFIIALGFAYLVLLVNELFTNNNTIEIEHDGQINKINIYSLINMFLFSAFNFYLLYININYAFRSGLN